MIGPGVRNNGDDATWADHTDTRPTMLNLVGLQDSYVHDGRVLIDQLDARAVPQSLRAHRETLRRLGDVYKQLNAPFGQFGMDTLTLSTRAVKSNDSGDSTYTNLENQIDSYTTQRDTLAGAIKSMLGDAAFGGKAINEQKAKNFISRAEKLLDSVHSAASALKLSPLNCKPKDVKSGSRMPSPSDKIVRWAFMMTQLTPMSSVDCPDGVAVTLFLVAW